MNGQLVMNARTTKVVSDQWMRRKVYDYTREELWRIGRLGTMDEITDITEEYMALGYKTFNKTVLHWILEEAFGKGGMAIGA